MLLYLMNCFLFSLLINVLNGKNVKNTFVRAISYVQIAQP